MKSNLIVLFCFSFLYSCVESYDGKKIYQTQCANCHGKNGEGLKKLIPPIANSDFVRNNEDRLSCIIRNGLHDTIFVNGVMYYQKMPDNLKLSSVDIANLINYINKQWYSERPVLTPDKIDKELEKCRE